MSIQEASIKLHYLVYDDSSSLPDADAQLLEAARAATSNSYAPYSKFNVAAAGLLEDHTIITGTNQENASFPAGMCAERVLLSAAISQYPNTPIKAMAISYQPVEGPISDIPVSPCGICRQVLSEYEERFGNIKLILAGMTGPVYVITSATHLLPLVFGGKDLK